MRRLDRLQPLALLTLRLVLGIILVAHGYPKVLGGEFHKHMGFVGNLGLPTWLAVFSAGTEFFGGILLILGLATRVVGVFATIEMIVIVAKVHWKAGLTGQGGYQFPLALGTMAFALIFLGAGPISLDWVFARNPEHH
jgi:putative oxidoreductase